MSESTRMMLGLVIGIVIMIVLVLKTKIHTFIALLLAALITGLIGGMPVSDIKDAAGKVQRKTSAKYEKIVILSWERLFKALYFSIILPIPER